ncbi:hypothetical protein HPB49_008593 [Dermacentor silvarum]|uniref:Uncharacterized protein n=1 Tax=Dermacentor silvarum TaxID=543639 RepID=A0ACB8DXX1_DERSI|nr:hypothetical protein HPB49_008593 [Dermacentor silvarum]
MDRPCGHLLAPRGTDPEHSAGRHQHWMTPRNLDGVELSFQPGNIFSPRHLWNALRQIFTVLWGAVESSAARAFNHVRSGNILSEAAAVTPPQASDSSTTSEYLRFEPRSRPSVVNPNSDMTTLQGSPRLPSIHRQANGASDPLTKGVPSAPDSQLEEKTAIAEDTLVYYNLTYSSILLGEPYRSFALVAAAAYPGRQLGVVAVSYLRRRTANITLYVFASICSAAAIFDPAAPPPCTRCVELWYLRSITPRDGRSGCVAHSRASRPLLRICGRLVAAVDRELQSTDYVCEKHFEPRYVTKMWEAVYKALVLVSAPRKAALAKHAVPTKFPGYPAHLTDRKKRKAPADRSHPSATKPTMNDTSPRPRVLWHHLGPSAQNAHRSSPFPEVPFVHLIYF